MARHLLEERYNLSSAELLDAINERFRLKVALEGAVAEYHMGKHIREQLGRTVSRFESHDQDGHPDFSLWVPGRTEPIFAECKNVRESSRAGGEGYRRAGKIVAYKVETQKTRAATADRTSRFYDADYFYILGVCLGKKTGYWTNVLFASTVDLARHDQHPHKLAVFQRVPLLETDDLFPWYADLGELLKHLNDPPH